MSRVANQSLTLAVAALFVPIAQISKVGMDGLLEPVRAALARAAAGDPAGAEARFTLVLMAAVVVAELVYVVPVLFHGLATQSAAGRSAGGRRHRSGPALQGLVAGAGFGVVAYFGVWWFAKVPTELTYRGFIGCPWAYAPVLFGAVGALAGVCEEVYFRGFLYRSSREFMPAPWAVLLNAAFFVGTHPQTIEGLSGHMGVLAGMTWLCCRLAERSSSVFPAAACHAAVNVVFVALANI